jgi:hypothetical protein
MAGPEALKGDIPTTGIPSFWLAKHWKDFNRFHVSN